MNCEHQNQADTKIQLSRQVSNGQMENMTQNQKSHKNSKRFFQKLSKVSEDGKFAYEQRNCGSEGETQVIH